MSTLLSGLLHQYVGKYELYMTMSLYVPLWPVKGIYTSILLEMHVHVCQVNKCLLPTQRVLFLHTTVHAVFKYQLLLKCCLVTVVSTAII